jgi:hypothetical protein
MKIFPMLTAAVAIAAAVPAQAQTNGQTPSVPAAEGWTHKVDLSSILCKELPGLQKPQVEQIVTWLQGYYTLEKAPRIVDPDKIKADVTKLDTYCKQNPEANLVAAADDVMGEPSGPAPAAKPL